MMVVSATAAWRDAHAGATIGLLEASGIDNAQPSARLDARKREIEGALRERYRGFSRPDFLALPVMAAYERYYKRFSKTYHVQLQLESIVLKSRRLPDLSPAVDANFMAEVETLVLTAGHDADRLVGPVEIDVSREGESMTQMNGTTRAIRAGDMVMRDAGGICCSIIYGQDARSPIAPATSHVLYVTYAPPGVGADGVQRQLRAIGEYLRLGLPHVVVEQERLLTAETAAAGGA
jgi:DNA/RNA-binding domain of Phe-tRNA-synthetase-like protein